MMADVQEKEARRGRTRYRLTDTERGHAWGDCAEVEGLFGETWRETYELFGWVPEGAAVLGWVGRDVWWVPQDGALDPWLLEDAESLGPHPGTDGLVLTGLDGHLGPPEDHRGTVLLHDGRRLLGSCRGFTRILPPGRSDPRSSCGGSARARSSVGPWRRPPGGPWTWGKPRWRYGTTVVSRSPNC